MLQLLKTQSRNSEAKLALCADDFLINFYEQKLKKKFDWNVLNDKIYVSHEVFGFKQDAFYYSMFRKVINNLIDTGVMKYLSENYYSAKPKFLKVRVGPKVLRVGDLSFGFNIWLGFCILSFIAFIFEQIYKNAPKILINLKIFINLNFQYLKN